MRVASLLIVTVACTALCGAAFGQNDKPGKGHGGPPPGHGSGNASSGNPSAGGGGQSTSTVIVPDRDRATIGGYYHTEYTAGRCPPGLAKKNNGCLPPGQAKKQWEVGRPLPMDVIYEPLPPSLLGRVSPPGGYQYVRVANDILMMAIGTRMIAGAVADLSRF